MAAPTTEDLRNVEVPRQAVVLATWQTFFAAEEFVDATRAFSTLEDAVREVGNDSVLETLRKVGHFKIKQLLEKLSGSLDLETPLRGKSVVIIGAGPGGLRTGIQAASLGADVKIIERRPQFTRHNVLKLWPGVVDDLLSLGLKVFLPTFSTSGSEKICIRRVQLVLLKVALLVGCRVLETTAFEKILPPRFADAGWRIAVEAESGDKQELECDCLVGSDGENSIVVKAVGFESTMKQFSKAIGITFNFEKSSRVEEVRLKEFSRAKQFFPQWFAALETKTGVSLESFVYFKDETHYFVMSATHQSLLARGILKQERQTMKDLLARDNVDNMEVCRFARQIAEEVGLPENISFAQGAHGPDLGVFDFTSKRASNASTKVLQAPTGQRLLVTLVGDAAVAPFWPLGTGANKAILGAYDACYAMVKFSNLGNSASATEIQAMLQRQHEIFVTMKQVNKSDEIKQNAPKQGARDLLCGSPTKAGRSTNFWELDPKTRYCNIPNPSHTTDDAARLLEILPVTLSRELSVKAASAVTEEAPTLDLVMATDDQAMEGDKALSEMFAAEMCEEDVVGDSFQTTNIYSIPEEIGEWLRARPYIKSMDDMRAALTNLAL